MTFIKITCGSKNDHYGLTEFNLAADGRVYVANLHIDKKSNFEAEEDPESWKPLAEGLLQFNGVDALRTRKGTAHEALYEIEISVGDKPTAFSVWHNDVKKIREVAALMARAKDCVKKCSDGQVQL